jgi:uncharacterized protein YqjF (DUF2071 family)
MPFLTAEWRKLAIANYAVDPEILKSFLPAKTELDLWNGTCYVSLVGFLFVNTKLKGIPVPFHVNFEEINLRFYVVHKPNENEIRRGVCFIKEIVSKPALALVARTIYKEQYMTLPTKYELEISEHEIAVQYFWKMEKWNSIKIIAENKQMEMAAGSAEEFITEHYWGYTKIDAEKTSEYPVHHPRWKVYPAKEYSIQIDFGNVYGHEFAFLNEQKPASVMLAEGSEISVHAGKKL